MRLLKFTWFIAFSLISLSICSQVTSTSKRFEVKDYIAMNSNGEYYPYHAHGFVENVGSGSSAKIFLLPIFKIDLENIIFFDSLGLPMSSNNNNIFSISIPVSAEWSLPKESQMAAIGASLSTGSSQNFYFSSIVKNNFGGPVIHPSAGIYTAQIMAMTSQYDQKINEQNAYIDAYKKYNPELISLSNYEVIVKVGNDIVYNEEYPGTYISTGKSLDDISIDKPSNYVKNRIAAGNFSIHIQYKFLDAKVKFINANVNAKVIVDQFLSEIQQSTVSQKSSGWSFLGFGSRRKSIKSKFDHQVRQQYTASSVSGTTIEMYDADDDMIELFENAFFPTLSRQRTIDNHIEAAGKAQQSGNNQLQNLHLDYVKALQTNDPDLEVNIGEAVAALAKKDYIGFIAKGVRWGDVRADGNMQFRRVFTENHEFAQQSDWSQTKKIPVQHVVTQKVSISEEVEYKAYLGSVGLIPYQGNHYITNGYTTQWENIKGIILGPIVQGGSFHLKNILPGTLLIKIGGSNVFDAQSLANALKTHDPGDQVSVTLIEPVGQNVYKKNNLTLVSGAYPK